ncbi:MAG: AMP-binding protein [Clostridia bacterium]|nr:AMP-binding protein [Clostridia bacterium]
MVKPLKPCAPAKVIADLRDLVRSNAECFGDKPQYFYKDKSTKVYKEFTYNDMYDHVNAIGTAFSVLGVMGKHIAVIGETWPDYVSTYYATVLGGGVIVPLDRELALDEIVNFCNLAEIEAIVYTEAFNNKLTPLADRMTGMKYFIPMNEGEKSTSEKVKTLDEVLEIGREEIRCGNRTFLDCEVEPDTLAAILFTSGTTGTSKGVMLTHGNLTAAINASTQTTPYDYNSVFVSVLPIHHTYEMTCQHFAASNDGAAIYINDSLKNVLRNFAKFKPNALALVPLFVETMHKRIWSEIDKRGMRKKVRAAMKLSNALLKVGIDKRDKFFGQITGAFGGELRSIICGGAPISPDIIKDFEAFGITVLEGYGITECAPLVAVNRPGEIRYHSVGRAVPGCEVRIDKNDPNDETGEICVKGANVMIGYYKNEEATREAFTDDGWFRTGDIGYIDKDGYIFITGRKKNVIILSNGKNVFPEEVESYLYKCELIKECVVIGRENANGEVVITALVYPDDERRGDMTDEQVRDAIKAEINEINRALPSFKQVREVELRSEEFEKTTSKKIKRFLLK